MKERKKKMIYNSRNFSILLNNSVWVRWRRSTTVEIFLYYLTLYLYHLILISTTVEIFLYYLTVTEANECHQSTTVEIILYYLTIHAFRHNGNLQQ